LHLLRQNKHSLGMDELEDLVQRTKGYSGADIKSLCSEVRQEMKEARLVLNQIDDIQAAMGPLRMAGNLAEIDVNEVRPIDARDFYSAIGMLPFVSGDVVQNRGLTIYDQPPRCSSVVCGSFRTCFLH